MAELKLGYNPYYYIEDYKVYNGLESSKRISGSNEQDFCGMSWDPSAYANKSDVNIITGIKISYRRKYAKDDGAALSGSVKYFFYPYAITSPSVSGNHISGNRGKLSTNTQSVEFSNTSWSGIETKTLATDAVYEKNAYTITASAGVGGSISPLGSTQVVHGDSQTYTITPNEGYEIESVTVDGMNKGAITSYTFSNVLESHTISATFKTSKTNKIYVGTSQPKSIYVGTSEVKAVYVGTNKVYG